MKRPIRRLHKAVLLTDKGWSSQVVAESLLISDQAVFNHIKDLETKDKVKPANGGSDKKLPEELTKKLLLRLVSPVYLLNKRYHFPRPFNWQDFLECFEKINFAHQLQSIVQYASCKVSE